jgi:hypothetical protein
VLEEDGLSISAGHYVPIAGADSRAGFVYQVEILYPPTPIPTTIPYSDAARAPATALAPKRGALPAQRSLR